MTTESPPFAVFVRDRLLDLKISPHQIFVGCIAAVSIAAFAACVGLVIVLV